MLQRLPSAGDPYGTPRAGGRSDIAPVVLVIDPDGAEQGRATTVLKRAGMAPVGAASAMDGLRTLYSDQPDAVLLDTAVPDMDGYQLIERIREVTDVPIVVVSEGDTEAEKVQALRSGADDYVVKPASAGELVARAEALIRRCRSNDDGPVMADGTIHIDLTTVSVHACGRPLYLTPLELRLLVAFVRHPGQVLSNERLLELAWGVTDAPVTGRVKISIASLRRKFRDAGLEPPIHTVRGFGYRYTPNSGAGP